jgi:hypothetical protein
MTMDKAQAIQKVLDLNRVAESVTFEGEVDSAREKAVHLRLKFGISDEDIAVAVRYEEDFTHFGHRVPFFDYNRVGPYLKAIKENINIVLGMVAEYNEPDDRMKLREQVEALGKFYRDLRDLVVADESDRQYARYTPENLAPSYEPRVRMVQGRYNVAVVAWYRFEVAKFRSEQEARPGHEDYQSRSGQARLDIQAHDKALMTMSGRGLTRTQVESIVKVYKEKLQARYRKIVQEEKGATA